MVTLYLDLSKAFDCVDHQILWFELKCLGFRPSAVKWYESYLTGRRQATQVGTTLSPEKAIECVVPQGSILGLLLFLCYLNDLESHLKYARLMMYADDTALTVCGNSIADISHKLNMELENITKYFAANKLMINNTKTKSMLFHSINKYNRDNEFLIMGGDIAIEQLSSIKYLGIFVDETLSFKEHIDYIGKKVRQRTGVLRKMRGFITQNLAK